MDDELYDTSLTLYAINAPHRALRVLLCVDQEDLDVEAEKLHRHLSTGRAQYEFEEEHEKIGALQACTWTCLRRDDRTAHGLIASLLYDRVTYRFIFHSDSESTLTTRRQKGAAPLCLLLAKAPTSLTNRFLAFLESRFQMPILAPFKLPDSHLSTSFSAYLSRLVSAHNYVADDYALQGFLQDTLGNTKLTISITSSEIAKHLRTIDIDLPPETLYQLVERARNASSNTARTAGLDTDEILGALKHHIHQRTGLLLPLTQSTTNSANSSPGGSSSNSSSEEADAEPKPPFKLTRISNAAFALGAEGRLKFSMRPVHAMDTVPGLPSGNEDNVVRRANTMLLAGLCSAASGHGGKDGGGGGEDEQLHA